MKKKISISINQETLEKLEELARTCTFRNKSHVVEFALNKLEVRNDN
jgi:Arc/MetJ-type ribon-helix-helix transcriptional regulator